uniref:RxLR effector candidate protein n=1 Tax=Hyaloperonospora arabidopsidis (strain Emoy2) TaxID=559515 RepID=M4B379_HYAAE
MRLFSAWMLTVAASSSTGVKALSTATKSTSDPPVVPQKLPSAVSSLRGADYGGIHSHRPSADSGEVGDPGESEEIVGVQLGYISYTGEPSGSGQGLFHLACDADSGLGD